MLWDTAGQEEFDTITRAYYRGAAAAVLAFSTSNRESLFAVKSWRRKLEAECGKLPTVLVQTKMDLIGEEVGVRPEEAEGLAAELGLRFHRISTKENLGVADVFRDLAVLAVRAQDDAAVTGGDTMGGGGEVSVAEIAQFGTSGSQATRKQQQQQSGDGGDDDDARVHSFEDLTLALGGSGQEGSASGGQEDGAAQPAPQQDGAAQQGGADPAQDGGGEQVRKPRRKSKKVGFEGGAANVNVNLPKTVVLVPTKRRTSGKKQLRDRVHCAIS